MVSSWNNYIVRVFVWFFFSFSLASSTASQLLPTFLIPLLYTEPFLNSYFSVEISWNTRRSQEARRSWSWFSGWPGSTFLWGKVLRRASGLFDLTPVWWDVPATVTWLSHNSLFTVVQFKLCVCGLINGEQKNQAVDGYLFDILNICFKYFNWVEDKHPQLEIDSSPSRSECPPFFHSSSLIWGRRLETGAVICQVSCGGCKAAIYQPCYVHILTRTQSSS